jgi:3-phenylpropionate/cinnamic acid dioxygenase small subunit
VDEGVAQLLDERAVRTVMLRYARGVDDRDWEQVRGCFAPDAFIAGTAHSGPRDEYLERLIAGVERYGATMHTIGNQVVEVDGDSARTETDLIARHFADADGREEVLVLGVRYHDQLRRDGDEWVVTRRDVRRLWTRP